MSKSIVTDYKEICFFCGRQAEIRRSEAMAKVGEQIIKTGELQLKAMQHMDEYGYDRKKTVPEMLEVRGGYLMDVEMAGRSSGLDA